MQSEQNAYKTVTANEMTIDDLLRAIVGDITAHESEARNFLTTMKKAAAGNEGLSLVGNARTEKLASVFNLMTKGKSMEDKADEVAELLLAEMDSANSSPDTALSVITPPDKKKMWEQSGLLPMGTVHEVADTLRSLEQPATSLHEAMLQLFRLSICFSANSVAGNVVASECLYAPPKRSTTKTLLHTLPANKVTIVVNDHAPMLSEAIYSAVQGEIFRKAAQMAGASGIQVYRTGNIDDFEEIESIPSEQTEILPLTTTDASAATLATGAIDLMVIDTQKVYPSVLAVANCQHTVLMTTGSKNRLPNIEHIADTEDQANQPALQELAASIVSKAIDSFKARRKIERRIPAQKGTAQTGFTLDSIDRHYGCLDRIASALIDGRIKGIVALSGCLSNSGEYGKYIQETVDILLQNNVLVYTNGCASLPLFTSNYCTAKAQAKCGDKLRSFLGSMPPVWHFGECLENAHMLATFREIAKYAGQQIKDLPFAAFIPQWPEHRGIGAALAYRAFGFDTYHYTATPTHKSQAIDELLHKRSQELLGSSMTVIPDNMELAETIITNFTKARSELCWR